MLAGSDEDVDNDDEIDVAATDDNVDDDDDDDDEENHDDDDDCNYLKIRKCEARTARARRIEVLAGRTRNL